MIQRDASGRIDRIRDGVKRWDRERKEMRKTLKSLPRITMTTGAIKLRWTFKLFSYFFHFSSTIAPCFLLPFYVKSL